MNSILIFVQRFIEMIIIIGNNESFYIEIDVSMAKDVLIYGGQYLYFFPNKKQIFFIESGFSVH